MRCYLFILGPSLRAAFRLESLLCFSLNFPLLDAGGGSHAVALLFVLFLRYSGAWTMYMLCLVPGSHEMLVHCSPRAESVGRDLTSSETSLPNSQPSSPQLLI